MRILPILMLAALAIPVATAHGAVEVLEVETLVLADEASDVTYAWDGFDITQVYVREAHWRAFEADGLIVRILASGGTTTPRDMEHAFELSMTGSGPATFRLASSDGIAWQGDLEILEADNTVDETTGAVNVNMQVFVPLEALGVTWGDTVTDITLQAFAGGQIVDTAPGGYYVGGVPVALSDPMSGTSSRVTDVALDGPDGYTKSNVTFDGSLSVAVTNPIHAAGQHLFLVLSTPASSVTGMAGETPFTGLARSVEPGQAITWTAEMPAFDVLRVAIESDLGGREVFYVRSDGLVSSEPLAALPSGDAADVDAPGLPLAFLLVALVALARRQ